MVQHFQNSSLLQEDKRCRPVLFHSTGPNAGEAEVSLPPGWLPCALCRVCMLADCVTLCIDMILYSRMDVSLVHPSHSRPAPHISHDAVAAVPNRPRGPDTRPWPFSRRQPRPQAERHVGMTRLRVYRSHDCSNFWLASRGRRPALAAVAAIVDAARLGLIARSSRRPFAKPTAPWQAKAPAGRLSTISRQCRVSEMYTRRTALAVTTLRGRSLNGAAILAAAETPAGQSSFATSHRVLPVQASGPWFCQLVNFGGLLTIWLAPSTRLPVQMRASAT